MLSYGEDLLEAFETYAEANLGTYLSAIETDKADSIGATSVTGIEVGVYDVTKYSNFPHGFLVPVSEEYEPQTMGTDLVTVTAELWLIDQGPSEANLTVRVARMASAVRNMVSANDTLGTTVHDCYVSSVEYYPRIYGVEHAQGVRVTLTLSQEV